MAALLKMRQHAEAYHSAKQKVMQNFNTTVLQIMVTKADHKDHTTLEAQMITNFMVLS